MLEMLTDKVKQRLRDWTLKQTEALSGGETSSQVTALARTQNEYGVDPFGFSLDYALAAAAPLLWIYRHYHRGKLFGVGNVPSGRVLLVSNHSGQIPMDGAMIGVGLLVEGRPPRAVRSMVEKWVPTLPYVSTFMARTGQIVGTP